MKKLISASLAFAVIGIAASTNAAVITEATADTYIRSDLSERSFGSDTAMVFGNTGNTTFSHGLLTFNLNDLGLIGQTVTSVSLNLTTTGNDTASSTSYTLNLFQLSAANSGWVEGTTTATPNASQSTWQKRNATSTVSANNSGTNWAGSQGASTSGTDFSSTLLSSVTGNPRTSASGTVLTFNSSANFISSIQGAIGGNISFWVGNDVAERDFFRIASRDHLTLDGPTLNITVVPEPSTLGLVSLALGGIILSRRRLRRGEARVS